MKASDNFQVGIIGGGLGGLTLAIQLADAGYSCILFEKNSYPFHKVCGEYISMESWNFLERIGLNPSALELPKINQLHISSLSGKLLKHELVPGGFGISRFTLDHKLYELAKQKGVTVLENCRVTEAEFKNDSFMVKSSQGIVEVKLCVGAWGKKSNMDAFRRGIPDKRKNNYVAIKYHLKLDFPEGVIELHNFKNGYCGISKIENDVLCMCYLTAAKNLKKYKGNIKKMEEGIVMKNPFLKHYFQQAHFLFNAPLAISQVKIGYKSAVENQLLLLGDAAGNIAPLSGNGMSIAMRSSFELFRLMDHYFNQVITRESLNRSYELFWKKEFKKRINRSKTIQRLLKNSNLTNGILLFLKQFPVFRKALVKSTHGAPF